MPLTIKYEKNSCLQRTKIREALESLQKEINTAQDTQFQIKEGIDWTRLHKLREAATFTVISTRHLSDQERNALALELMSFRIKYFFLSKAQVMLNRRHRNRSAPKFIALFNNVLAFWTTTAIDTICS